MNTTPSALNQNVKKGDTRSTRRLLFVKHDPSEGQSLQQEFAALNRDWQLDIVQSGPEALERLKTTPYDAVVTDMYVPGMDGVQLLNEIGHQYPNIIRFIQANDADKESIMRGVLGAHQFLPRVCDASRLCDILNRTLALDTWLTNPKIKALVGRIRTFPTIPTLYVEVLRELNSTTSSTQRVGEIISKDLAMTTKVLQVLNSAYYGLSRQITDLSEGVGILGFDTVKSLVLCIQLFSQYDKVKPIFFSIDRLWRHSNVVARTAREIVLLEGGKDSLAEEAFTAGLMHDIGKLVLVSNFEEQYAQAQSLAQRSQTPLWIVEQEVFGVGHSEIGAYLLGLWGMPLSIIEAAALHHFPTRSADKTLSPLTAVHIANTLICEQAAEKDGLPTSSIDSAYLAQLGIPDRSEEWRRLLTEQTSRSEILMRRDNRADKSDVPAMASQKIVESRPVAAGSPIPTRATVYVRSAAPIRLPWYYHRRVWVGGGALAAVVILGLALQYQRPASDLETVSTNLVNQTAAVTMPHPSDAKEPAAALPDRGSELAALEPAIPDAASFEWLDAFGVAVESFAPLVSDQHDAAPVPEPVPPAKVEFPKLTLQGISYNAAHPVAMINGKSLSISETIKGAKILSIGPNTVIFEFEGRREALQMSP